MNDVLMHRKIAKKHCLLWIRGDKIKNGHREVEQAGNTKTNPAQSKHNQSHVRKQSHKQSRTQSQEAEAEADAARSSNQPRAKPQAEPEAKAEPEPEPEPEPKPEPNPKLRPKIVWKSAAKKKFDFHLKNNRFGHFSGSGPESGPLRVFLPAWPAGLWLGSFIVKPLYL